MFRVLKILLLMVVIVGAVSWLINNNGEVVINWLGYEIVTDIFMIVVLVILSVIFIFVFTYILMKIFSFRFSSIAAKFVDRSNAKKLDRAKKDQDVAYEYLTRILAYLDECEVKKAKKFYKKFCALTRNKEIIEYLNFRLKYFESDFYQLDKKREVGLIPGSSPGKNGQEESYFTFAKSKGWTK